MTNEQQIRNLEAQMGIPMLIQIVCGWCRMSMGSKPGTCEAGMVSHSICVQCLANMGSK